MKLRTIAMTLLLALGLTVSAYAAEAAQDSKAVWTATGLPGKLPAGWSVYEDKESGSPFFVITRKGQSEIFSIIALIPPHEVTGSLESMVDQISEESGGVRDTKVYGKTTVESFTNDKGLYFAMAEYESQVYAFIKMKNQTTDEQAGQDELYRNAFGKEKKK